jgi:rubredoxin/uncharacterized membrane protein
MKKWKCTVCGYIHEGEYPPEKCPVCGADRTKFIEIAQEVPVSEPASSVGESSDTPSDSRFYKIYRTTTRWMTRLHGHPISVHIPNGVLPVSVIFLFLGILFESSAMCLAAFYNMVFVVISMPIVLFSGYIDWKNRFGGNLTRLFVAKMICCGFVSLTGLLLVTWRLIDPFVAAPDSGNRISFLLAHILMLGVAVLAGYLGGKLVFKD